MNQEERATWKTSTMDDMMMMKVNQDKSVTTNDIMTVTGSFFNWIILLEIFVVSLVWLGNVYIYIMKVLRLKISIRDMS